MFTTLSSYLSFPHEWLPRRAEATSKFNQPALRTHITHILYSKHISEVTFTFETILDDDVDVDGDYTGMEYIYIN